MSQDARFDEEQSTQRRARLLGFEYVDTSKLAERPLFKDVLSLAELYSLKMIPLQVDEHNILFGVTTTTAQATMSNVKRRFIEQQIKFVIISDTGYSDYMKLYDPPKEVVYQDVKLGTTVNADLFKEVSLTLDQVRADDILAYLVKQAYQLKASDIHLECQKEGVRIRFRVDGVLHPIAMLAHGKYRQLSSAIAIASNVSTSSPEAQTGHINRSYKMATGEDVTVNLRVEAIPTVFGQDFVMRLFNLKLELLRLENLGLNENERVVVDDIIQHPTGMVLVVGPTGSGKTTTLYSLINTLNTSERKIITLEDPVEYFMPGVVQIPVDGDHQVAGFAEKLRAVLRLDPDVVMIGEIRDQDTAKTALQAALTGHLVLSTFHASNAAAALTRMLDAIGINPLFASAIHLVMAQRLVRRLDDATKQPYQPDERLVAQLQTVIDTLPVQVEKPNLHDITLYSPGSSAEYPFGYNGQIALREQLQMTPNVREMLRLPPQQITTQLLEEEAVKDGMLTMLQNGILMAVNGHTTIEEVYRVVG